MAVQELITRWREEAGVLKTRYADERAAKLFQVCADELEQALRVTGDELLTLTQAARISGYSPDYLGRLIREGTVPNAGRPKAPKIRRSELPMKATARGAAAPALTSRSPAHHVGSSASALARSVVGRRKARNG
jgi:hypothetical protein